MGRTRRRAALCLAAVSACALLAGALPGAAAAEKLPVGTIYYYVEGDPAPAAGESQRIADTLFNPGRPEFVYTVEQYFLTQTYGAVDFSGGLKDIYGPYPVKGPKTGCPFNQWDHEAEVKAQADGYSPSNYSVLLYIFENKPFEMSPCGAAGVGGGSFTWIDGLSGYTIAHEFGHVLGAPHAAAYRCFGPDGTTHVAYSDNCREVYPPSDEPNEYGDPFDPMGHGANGALPTEMTAWRKLGFGAIPAGDAPTIQYSGTYTVAPLEQSSGVRMLRLPSGVSGDLLDIDFRQRIGFFDEGYAADAPAIQGVALHLDAAKFELGAHPSHLLDMTPDTPLFDDATLTAGHRFTDFRTGITIETVSIGPAGATVKVSGLPDAPVSVCKVPKLKGKKLKAARKAASKAGCRLGKVRRRHSKKVARGKVISQKAKAGRTLAAGAKLDVVVSSGPPKKKR